MNGEEPAPVSRPRPVSPVEVRRVGDPASTEPGQGLHSEPFAPLAATVGDHPPPADRAHALPETVRFRALATVRLVSPLHLLQPLLSRTLSYRQSAPDDRSPSFNPTIISKPSRSIQQNEPGTSRPQHEPVRESLSRPLYGKPLQNSCLSFSTSKVRKLRNRPSGQELQQKNKLR